MAEHYVRPLNGAKRCASACDVSLATWWRWVKADPNLKACKVGGRTLWTGDQLRYRIQQIVQGEAA